MTVLSSIWTYRGIRWTVCFLFLYAGVGKLMDPEAFATVISDLGLLPEHWIAPLAVGLPILEIAAALGLLFEVYGCLAVIAGLLVFFMAILAYSLWLGLDIDCGCLGPADPESRGYGGLKAALYRDLLMMFGALYMYWWRSNRSAWVLRLERVSEIFGTRRTGNGW